MTLIEKLPDRFAHLPSLPVGNRNLAVILGSAGASPTPNTNTNPNPNPDPDPNPKPRRDPNPDPKASYS